MWEVLGKMVSITLSVPEEVRTLMKRFPEVNWSGFVRSSIEEKARQLAWREEMLRKLKEEGQFVDWSVSLGKAAKKNRFGKLLSQLPAREREQLLKE